MNNEAAENWRTHPEHVYKTSENAEYKVWYAGVVFSLEETDVKGLPLRVGKAAYEDSLDYNTVHGWYKMAVYAKAEDGWLFFGDNAGSQCFFLDRENACFSDSLLSLRALRGEAARPDMTAVAQLCDMERTLGERTVVDGIFRTDPDRYYRYRNGIIETFTKGLADFAALPDKVRLDDIMAPAITAIGDRKICAVCTGGTDSRAVLANLAFHKLKPDLVITGHTDNPDIGVAEKIADKLGLSLKVIHPDEKESNWLEQSLFFLDGMYDVVLGYRHLQKARWVQQGGYAFELGGVGGEFYKNAFCHPIRWGFWKHRGEQFFMNTLFSDNGCAGAWCGDALKKAVDEELKSASVLVHTGMQEKKHLQRCNRIGYDLLRSLTMEITDGYANVCCKIDPLMDRGLVAAVSHQNPLSLCMHIWQRRETAAYCPDLSEIETDQGYSCSCRPTKLLKERCQRLMFYMSRVFARVRRKLGLPFTNGDASYWERDYAEARTTQAWASAMAYCKQIGLLHSDAEEDSIPMDKTGILLLVGMLFNEGFASLYSEYRKQAES